MPKYTVCVTADATQSYTVEIVATDQASAEVKALESIDYAAFEPDDCFPQNPYVSWSDEHDEPKRSKTRADLMRRPAWKELDTDSCGNPCVWLNHYEDEMGRHWDDVWSCQCDYDGISPYESEWIGPEDEAEIALWESLPEAQ